MASYGDLSFATRGSKKQIKGMEWPVKVSNTGGMFSNNYNEESVKDGLIQLLLTARGERPMRLDYGTDLRRSVFAPLDETTVSNLRQSILNAISKYEPRIVVRSFEVTPESSKSQINVSLVFSLKNSVLAHDTVLLTVNTKGVVIHD